MERNDQRPKAGGASGKVSSDTTDVSLREFIRATTPPEHDRMQLILSQLVKARIVPQLVMAEKSGLAASRSGAPDLEPSGWIAPQPGHASAKQHPTASDRQQFEIIVLYSDTFDCFSFVSALRERGVSLPDIYLGLFQPVAEHLGQRWSEDSLSFMEVTRAVSHMQTLVRALGAGETRRHPIDEAHKIVLACPRHEQHALGMLIVSQLFEMEGWDVEGGTQLGTGDQLNDLVHDEWFGVVGLSASSEDGARKLKTVIDDLRSASMNDSISVIVGGQGFAGHPELTTEIGADGLALDGRDAVAQAERLLTRRRKHPDPSR